MPIDTRLRFTVMLVRSSAERFARFMDRFGEVMPAERQRLYERLLASALPHLTRFDGGRNLTLVHGDAHWWNCFLPRDEQRDRVRILDWEDWTIGTATTDLGWHVLVQ
jgi:aminoglycoside phosphotransferase (APT) family kinase protein